MDIYGNSFLISVAWNTDSPSKAAKVAQLFGCSREEVRAVRNAGALKRDFGIESFKEKYEPFDIVDTNIQQCRSMSMRISIDKTFEQRALNSIEFNEVANYIEKKLNEFGVRVLIDRKKSTAHEKSTLEIV
jgi:hypothetical protein